MALKTTVPLLCRVYKSVHDELLPTFLENREDMDPVGSYDTSTMLPSSTDRAPVQAAQFWGARPRVAK